MRISRGELRRMQRHATQHLGHFELRDGTTYYYDREKVGGQVWAYALAVQIRSKYTDDIGEPPEIVTKIREAEDPLSAVEPFRPLPEQNALVDPIVLIHDAPQSP